MEYLSLSLAQLKQYEQNSITAEQLLDAVLNSSAPGSDQLLPGDLVMVIKGINTAVLNMNSKQRLSTAKVTEANDFFLLFCRLEFNLSFAVCNLLSGKHDWLSSMGYTSCNGISDL